MAKSTDKPVVFQVVFLIGPDRYQVEPLRGVHPEVARKAYRFWKQTGGQEVYDVRQAPEGFTECDCPGHQRWGTPCKHVKTLVAAGVLDPSALEPERVNLSAPVPAAVDDEF